MQKPPKEHWKIKFINRQQEEEWNISYSRLGAGYRWQVDSALNYMILYKQPWKKYPHMACDECMEDLYLLDVSHKGIGSMIVQIMVLFDKPKHRLIPIHCEIADLSRGS